MKGLIVIHIDVIRTVCAHFPLIYLCFEPLWTLVCRELSHIFLGANFWSTLFETGAFLSGDLFELAVLIMALSRFPFSKSGTFACYRPMLIGCVVLFASYQIFPNTCVYIRLYISLQFCAKHLVIGKLTSSF